MYRPFNVEDDLVQGDIIEHVVFTYVESLSSPNLYNEAGAPTQIAMPAPIRPQDRLEISGQAETSRVILISQDCDILSKPFVCVGRIHELSVADREYAGKNSDRAKADYIQKNYQRPAVQPAVFYLQESEPHNFPKSRVSFMELHSIKTSADNLQYLRQNRILRLSQESVFDLQFRFSFYFGRFATADNYMLTEQERGLMPH